MRALLLLLLALALAGCADSPSTYDQPYPEAEAADPCLIPDTAQIDAVVGYMRQYPADFPSKPVGPWQSVAADDRTLVAVRLADGSAATFLLEGGPVYGVTWINRNFPGAAVVESCLS
jgi:hypothetical protein